jgi:hypothetical protein
VRRSIPACRRYPQIDQRWPSRDARRPDQPDCVGAGGSLDAVPWRELVQTPGTRARRPAPLASHWTPTSVPGRQWSRKSAVSGIASRPEARTAPSPGTIRASGIRGVELTGSPLARREQVTLRLETERRIPRGGRLAASPYECRGLFYSTLSMRMRSRDGTVQHPTRLSALATSRIEPGSATAAIYRSGLTRTKR